MCVCVPVCMCVCVYVCYVLCIVCDVFLCLSYYTHFGTTSAFVAEWLRRYVQVVVLSEGAGSSPVECIFVRYDTANVRVKNRKRKIMY